MGADGDVEGVVEAAQLCECLSVFVGVASGDLAIVCAADRRGGMMDG
jgi:hypothetical protein